jgi:O-antigen/teichoic acid export membrane protein
VQISFIVGGVVLLYGGVLSFFSSSVLNFVYAGRYSQDAGLVPLFMVSLAASAVTGVLTTALKSLELVRLASLVWVVSALVAIVFSPYLILSFNGVQGAGWALLITYSSAMVVAYIFIRRYREGK